MTACLISAMRNEGTDVLEWVAWHRVIGFDRIVIWTNDCSDGSDLLLDALADLGWITHHRHTPGTGISAQGNVATLAHREPMVASSDWLMWLDADEFLNVHHGAGRLPDLLDVVGPADGIALNWRLFGDNGHDNSPPGLVTETFTQASLARYRLNRTVKTLHRMDDRVSSLFIHRPVWHDDPQAPINLLAGSGGRLGREFLYYTKENGNPQEMVERGAFGWSIAQINHYAVKALERVAVKQIRGDGLYANWTSRFDLRYLRRFNKNDETDISAYRHLAAVKAEMTSALSSPSVRRAHDACASRFRAILQQVASQTRELARNREGRIAEDMTADHPEVPPIAQTGRQRAISRQLPPCSATDRNDDK